jgi:hypothetical protein
MFWKRDQKQEEALKDYICRGRKGKKASVNAVNEECDPFSINAVNKEYDPFSAGAWFH